MYLGIRRSIYESKKKLNKAVDGLRDCHFRDISFYLREIEKQAHNLTAESEKALDIQENIKEYLRESLK